MFEKSHPLVSFQQNKNRSKKETSKKNIIALIITSSNSAKPFKFLKKAFDHMAIFIDMPVTIPRVDRIDFWRNRIFTVFSLDIVENAICPICLVRKNIAFRKIKARQKIYSHCGIMDVSRSEKKLQRIPQCICKGVNFGIQTTFCASYGF